ncbi:hypothetical protein DES53_103417 [Roseimicrobium gellanilyticum]|uniref:Uncharacterized protein n=1 Tax=Roseimicrobium gellanilyticum TaxID=748857 RepID=A0A366HRP5_9BACT|nr:hypothetical protein [Roseimicrobium gellanilyticum]RBP45418.1 hypothetical protein DES53_103417 [Roseimicrobium gellanilyticum]
MTPPRKSSDPLLQSLAAEAIDLPARAALVARQRALQRRLQQRGLVAAAAVVLLGVSVWWLRPGDVSKAPVIASNTTPLPTPVVRALVQVQTEEEARLHPPPMPEGLDREQQALIAAAPDLPLLIVRDNGGGRVTRIHVIERE